MPLFYCGPSGGTGGDPIDFRDQVPQVPPGPPPAPPTPPPPPISVLEDSFVRRIDVWYGSFIETIFFTYQSLTDPNKTFDAAIGGFGGETKEFFHLGRDEAIVGIRGWYGRFVDSLDIETINIYTGKKKVHAFGGLGDRRVSIPGSAASTTTDSPARSTTGRYGNRGALGRRRAVRGLNRSHPTTPVSVVARPLYEHRISLFTALPTRCLLGNPYTPRCIKPKSLPEKSRVPLPAGIGASATYSRFVYYARRSIGLCRIGSTSWSSRRLR